MILVSIKFKFQDLNPIIDRDRARWMKKEPSGASTNSCNIYCISKCKQKWLLNGWFDFKKENGLFIIHNSWIRSSKGMQLRLFLAGNQLYELKSNRRGWCCGYWGKKNWHFHLETATFEHRHENKSCSACRKDQIKH